MGEGLVDETQGHRAPAGLLNSWRTSVTSSHCVLCRDGVLEVASIDANYVPGGEEDMVCHGHLSLVQISILTLLLRYPAFLWAETSFRSKCKPIRKLRLHLATVIGSGTSTRSNQNLRMKYGSGGEERESSFWNVSLSELRAERMWLLGLMQLFCCTREMSVWEQSQPERKKHRNGERIKSSLVKLPEPLNQTTPETSPILWFITVVRDMNSLVLHPVWIGLSLTCAWKITDWSKITVFRGFPV